jgi:hypothetical protein
MVSQQLALALLAQTLGLALAQQMALARLAQTLGLLLGLG